MTSKIVDIVEEKGHRSLWFKFLTPAAWFVGEGLGFGVAVGLTGLTQETMSSPMAQIDPTLSSSMFLVLVFRAAGALLAAAAVYLYARSLRTLQVEDTSFS